MRGQVGKKTPKKIDGEYDVKSGGKVMQFGLRSSLIMILNKNQSYCLKF